MAHQMLQMESALGGVLMQRFGQHVEIVGPGNQERARPDSSKRVHKAQISSEHLLVRGIR